MDSAVGVMKELYFTYITFQTATVHASQACSRASLDFPRDLFIF